MIEVKTPIHASWMLLLSVALLAGSGCEIHARSFPDPDTDPEVDTATETQAPDEQDSESDLLPDCHNDQVQCDPNATCHQLLDSTWTCVCRAGFDGDGLNCIQIDLCDPNPCTEAQECVSLNGTYQTCKCPAGYAGDQCDECGYGYQDHDGDGVCELACGWGLDDCNPNRTTCDDTDGTIQCLCAHGYTGSNCEIPPSCDGEITFPDPVLDTRVRKALGAWHGLETPFIGPIFSADVSTLEDIRIDTPFDGPGMNESISDLTGLHCLSNLKSINLSNNDTLSDLTPLASLTKLNWITLRFCNIEEYEPLRNLNELEWLSVFANPGHDFSPLEDLVNMKELYIGVNFEDVDFGFTAKMTELAKFHVEGAVIKNTSFLANFSKLQTLVMFYCQITDIDSIAELNEIEYLNLGANQITDISAIKDLTKLTELYLHKNDIIDISAVSALTNLERLVLSRNDITNIEAVSNLTKLYTLKLADNPIADITALVDNPGIDSNDEVTVTYTSCTASDTLDTIATLEARGVDLFHSCYDPW